MRTLLLGSVALLAPVLAACDGGSPEPTPPAACGTVAERADTVFVAVGDGAALDLDALFAGVEGGAFQYSVAGVAPSNGSVELRGDRGEEAFLRATALGARSFTVEATAICGGGTAVVGRASVALHAVRPGTVCTVPSRAVPPAEPWRLAVGGLPDERPLWGEGGLFEGPFNEDATFTYGSSALVVGATVTADGAPAVRLTPRSQEGAGTLTVTATDACFRTAQADVPVELIETPTCRIDYDPASLDYFPVGMGMEWRYEVRYNGVVQVNPEWLRVTAEGPCMNGSRTYALTGLRYTGLVVGGDSLRLLSPESSGDTPPMRRLYPPSAPPPEIVEVGPWGQDSRLRLRRGVGMEWMDYRHSFDRTIYTLLEGPTTPLGGDPQNATAAWRR